MKTWFMLLIVLLMALGSSLLIAQSGDGYLAPTPFDCDTEPNVPWCMDSQDTSPGLATFNALPTADCSLGTPVPWCVDYQSPTPTPEPVQAQVVTNPQPSSGQLAGFLARVAQIFSSAQPVVYGMAE